MSAASVPPDVYIVLDAVDAAAAAEFWAAALHYERADPLDPYEVLVPPGEHRGPLFLIQQVPEAKSGKNRVHVDLHVDDPAAEVQRLIALGATRVADGHLGEIEWTTMRDPFGNEFCIGRR